MAHEEGETRACLSARVESFSNSCDGPIVIGRRSMPARGCCRLAAESALNFSGFKRIEYNAVGVIPEESPEGRTLVICLQDVLRSGLSTLVRRFPCASFGIC